MHRHTTEVIAGGFGPESGDLFGHPTVPIRLHEVACIFLDDPTSDDSIEVGHLWVDEGSGTFPCPVCGDVLPEAPLNRPLTAEEAAIMFAATDEARAMENGE